MQNGKHEIKVRSITQNLPIKRNTEIKDVAPPHMIVIRRNVNWDWMTEL